VAEALAVLAAAVSAAAVLVEVGSIIVKRELRNYK
jgi:hypothetical protein